MTNHLITIIHDALADLNESLAYNFYYCISTGGNDIAEGAFAMPLHTDHLAALCADLSGFDSIAHMNRTWVLDRIDYIDSRMGG